MNTTLRTKGIHHITAVASSAVDNLNFYRNVLGLRLVKKTVNFDDPYTYHFYYGDPAGSPGTILTFFPWENIPRGRNGAGMVAAVAFGAPKASLAYWSQRLKTEGIDVAEDERFGEPMLRFSDPHGLSLEMIGVTDKRSYSAETHEAVPQRHAIIGFHSATAALRTKDDIHRLLVDDMGMELQGREGRRHRYRMPASDDPGIFYDVVQDDMAPSGRPGGGTVHHIAFRAKDEAEQRLWRQTLTDKGYAVTPVRDRNYFRSIYFTTPGGVLFEIATDPPGFTVDEPADQLGQALKLPQQYEPMRREIEARLPSLATDTFKHLFVEPSEGADADQTVVSLHGTGGSERDLLDLAGRIGDSAAILSPRGKVVENGMPRFFRRLAANVFDEEDLIRRTHELADFLMAAAPHYGRDLKRLTALGYSNGANIAAAVLLLRPEVFSRAILLRPMLPLHPSSLPDLADKEILILTGRRDTIIPADSTLELIRLLEQCGARMTILTTDAGHEITHQDVSAAMQWFKETAARKERTPLAGLTEPIH